MSPRVRLFGALACVIALHATVAGAAVIKLDASEYWMNLDVTATVTVEVVYEVTEASIDVANAGFRLESSPDAGVPGQLTTSIADVNQSSLTPYIFSPNAGFFDTGSGGTIATGGDNTDDGLVDTLTTADYYLASVTWTASGVPNDGSVYDFFLEFTSLGIVTVLTDPLDNDFLTSANGAVVHVVPEPTTVGLLALGSFAALRRRRA